MELSFTEKLKRWGFPKERFVTYEPSDESWCRYAGIGREVTVLRTVTFPQAAIVSIDAQSVTFEAFSSSSKLSFTPGT